MIGSNEAGPGGEQENNAVFCFGQISDKRNTQSQRRSVIKSAA